MGGNMRLRNKKTGEIIELLAKPSFVKRVNDYLQSEVNTFNSLAELNEEWEDYEEPKKYWHIDADFGICCEEITGGLPKWKNETGNLFETKEEAEKAVEKLKAWKRLKDKGMIKYAFHKEKTGIDLDFYTLTILAPRDKDSLDLLFGGEE